MKLKNLVKKAEEAIKSEKEEKALYAVRESLLNIESAKKTLAELEENHKELLEKDADEVEDMVY